jgi:hypothetical protein
MKVALVRLKIKCCIINATGSLNTILCAEVPLLFLGYGRFLAGIRIIVAKVLKE